MLQEGEKIDFDEVGEFPSGANIETAASDFASRKSVCFRAIKDFGTPRLVTE